MSVCVSHCYCSREVFLWKQAQQAFFLHANLGSTQGLESPERARTAAMMARQKGVRSPGVLDVIRFSSTTTSASVHVAPALMRSSFIAQKEVIFRPSAIGLPLGSLAEQNIQGP
mmetsp:Transcript_51368/g.134120  ORF Transcript_51368/g.134120 Transcript_51368/m.134120 type:complete len:114 (-) Transcript_51368:314-655(-)